MNKIKKIYRTIFKINDLSCRIIINLISNDIKYKPLSLISNEIVSLNYFPLLVLNIDSLQWNRLNSIVLSSRTIVHFILGIKKMIKKMEDNIYYYTKDKKLALGALDDSYYIRLTNLGDNNIVEMFPTIIRDRNMEEYEGARLCFNNLNTFIDLTIDELVSLHYSLSKIDLFTYSQLLINYVMMIQNKIEISNPNIENVNLDTPFNTITTGNFGNKNKSIFSGLKIINSRKDDSNE